MVFYQKDVKDLESAAPISKNYYKSVMKPLICPQCGGKITDYSPFQNFATCGYCATRFVIEPEKQKTTIAGESYYDTLPTPRPTPNIFVFIAGGAVLLVGGIIFLAVLMNKKEPKAIYPTYNKPSFPTLTPRASPTATPDLNLLVFGGKGTANGLFKEADALAVRPLPRAARPLPVRSRYAS